MVQRKTRWIQKEIKQQIRTALFLEAAREVPPPRGVVGKPNETAENREAAGTGKGTDRISQRISSALTSEST